MGYLLANEEQILDYEPPYPKELIKNMAGLPCGSERLEQTYMPGNWHIRDLFYLSLQSRGKLHATSRGKSCSLSHSQQMRLLKDLARSLDGDAQEILVLCFARKHVLFGRPDRIRIVALGDENTIETICQDARNMVQMLAEKQFFEETPDLRRLRYGEATLTLKSTRPTTALVSFARATIHDYQEYLRATQE